ncbi:amidase [Peribacillus glennii]|uniref:Amidase n=1 Tax=Peribacillus glennii TaxID=2303991 RepID=A0A372LAY7_9BACI|nr:amidase [Peribacillus glennii]RFU62469.1 amidase [Peribacillus glennii]
MKKLIMAALVVFLSFAGGVGGSAKATVTETKATWLWNPWMIVNDESGTIAFLEEKNLNKVYLQIDRDIPVTVYRSFIEKASSKGMKIYALDGAPQWVAPDGYKSLDRLMNWLKTYQNESSSFQKFAGVHLDVEPYLYSGWSTNQASTVKTYQALIMKAKSSATAIALALEADIPFWFDEISYKNTYGKGILAEWMIANTNSVTIMAYRDSASMIIELVAKEMALAAKYNKQLVIGVETGQTSEGGMLTFFEEGQAYMNQELVKVKDSYAGTPGYSGIAVHHVGSWMTMKP